ncbi:hypothetical protein [Mangrovicoccus sp. HB161399]|uniref:hypothetical protein n=1 Tax=Mangrovicoccus sp. HB161399 TaxID=2720392 RepID=UPI0015538A7C|nr:hypothetical protein [Mangrovicoccus sp. HB161399]
MIRELDPGMVTVLMAAGLVFASAGLWMLIRRDAASAKIELFGMKFESSSAGLLIAVIGAGFIATPLFVGTKTADSRRAEVISDPPPGPGTDVTEATPVPDPPDSPVPAADGVPPMPSGGGRRITVEAQEQEPNGSLASATEIWPGTSAGGMLADSSERDVFAVLIPDGAAGELVLSATAANVRMIVYDGVGNEISNKWRADRGALSFSTEVKSATYYVGIENWSVGRDTPYQLTAVLR